LIISLINKIQSLLATQRRNLKNLSSLVFVNFAVAGIGFFTQIKIANTLGKESFGYIAFGVAIATYCAVIIRFALDRTLVRDLIHYPDRFTAIVNASLMLRVTLLILIMTVIILWKLMQPSDTDVTWGVVLIIIANSLMSLDLQGVYDSWHEMSRHAYYNLVQRSLYFSMIWYLAIYQTETLSVLSVGMATLLAVCVYLMLQYSWAMRRLPSGGGKVNLMRMAFNMMRGNVVIWIAALAGLSFGPLNQLVLKHYYGAIELGGYAAAWMMVILVNMFLAQVARIGNPATARITSGETSMNQKIQFLKKYAFVMTIITLPVAAFVIIAPDFILGTFFKSEYLTSASALRVFGVYMVVFAVGQVASQYMISSRMEKIYTTYILIGGGLGVVLCFLLIPPLGGFGAACALLISHGTAISLYWWKVISTLRVNNENESDVY
jgi:O-antigen/teichoic acid export membrane protein